ncbi:MAG TPA: NAD(P)H-dependent oxidoreductase [Actinocrinis sp.]|nr:NAD(P)H-dependent oxidoreductase [Actinocrinis sp.]
MSRVLVFAGSLRRDSFTRATAQALCALAPADFDIEVYPLPDLPNYNPDDEGENVPAAVAELRAAIAAADGLVFVTPEYNRSIPGLFKNLVDWGSRPVGASVLRGKHVATLSASPGVQGGIRALVELRRLLTLVGGYEVLGPEIAVPEVPKRLGTDDQGRPTITDEGTAGMITKLLKGLQYSIDNALAAHIKLAAEHADKD